MADNRDDDGGDSVRQRVKGLVIPGGLIHPHLHLDKCFLLDQTPVGSGSFEEAVEETGKAKAKFDEDDLLRRGDRLIRESVERGVVAIRAHVEVDPTVGHRCLQAGQVLKERYKAHCDVRLAAFAQDPFFFPKNAQKQEKMIELFVGACQANDVSAIGSAPYVEQPLPGDSDNYRAQCQNVRMMFQLASRFDKDLDFHLDYNLDMNQEPLLWYVLQEAHKLEWKRMITIGHATRLSLFKQEEFARLQRLAQGLRVSFVGLPPSDLYMQGRETSYAHRSRATLPLLQLSSRGFPVALGVNNVSNLFTPQGDGDPLAMLPLVVGLWQTAKEDDLIAILSMVSLRARESVGLSSHDYRRRPFEDTVVIKHDGSVRASHSDLDTFTVLTDCDSLRDAVLSPSPARITVKDGKLVGWTRVERGITTC